MSPVRLPDPVHSHGRNHQALISELALVSIPSHDHNPRGGTWAEAGHIDIHRVMQMPAIHADGLDLNAEHPPRFLVKHSNLRSFEVGKGAVGGELIAACRVTAQRARPKLPTRPADRQPRPGCDPRALRSSAGRGRYEVLVRKSTGARASRFTSSLKMSGRP
jgi:hypothetical protein